MPNNTETIFLGLLISLTTGLIGFFLAALRQRHHISQLSTQLEQALHAQQTAVAQQVELQDKLTGAEAQRHELQISEGRLQATLQAAIETSTRLAQDLQDQKDRYVTLSHKFEQSSQQQHSAEKGLETAQTEGRALKQQIEELRNRLSKAEGSNMSSQAEIDRLKDDLASEGKKAKALEISGYEARERLAEAKETLASQTQSLQALQDRHQKLSTEHAELKMSLQNREEHFAEQKAQLAESRTSLTREFENIANKIFEEKGKTFTSTSQTSIDSLLKPFREQIEGFQKRINEVHDASLQGNTSLNAEIRKVLDIGLQMSKEASNLTSALKGDSQQRGAWGEAQLRRTLEMSGLIEEIHYDAQSSLKALDGKQKQTDYLIKLPDGKHIIIDSKVSLIAYDRAIAASSPEEYQLAMADHAKAVRRHIDDLSSKDYTNLVGIRSPSFVLMFMPIEPAYIEALKNNKDLFEYGYKKGIVLVSHTTLIPILRTVSNLWMIERSNSEAREISEKAGDIYNQVCVVAERLSKLGVTLHTVSNHYNDTVKAIAGKQGLYGKVERFNGLSTKVSKCLPALDPANMDFEAERLSLIIEEIHDASDENDPIPRTGHDEQSEATSFE